MEQGRETAVKPPSEYEPPRIEAELTDERLAREVQYAGNISLVE
jgi:hypothetical protein